MTGEKFVEANLTDAENLYDGYSWSTMVYDTSFYAKSEKQHLQISVTSNKDLFELKAYYTEPFDPEAVTDWKDEEKTKLKDYLESITTFLSYIWEPLIIQWNLTMTLLK